MLEIGHVRPEWAVTFIWNDWSRCRNHRSRSSGIPKITVNGAKKLLKAQSMRRNLSLPMVEEKDGELEEMAVIDERSPLSILEIKRNITALDKALADLPELMSTALLLRELEGMSYEQIAMTMKCPVGTVRSRIFRARELLALSMGTFSCVATADG